MFKNFSNYNFIERLSFGFIVFFFLIAIFLIIALFYDTRQRNLQSQTLVTPIIMHFNGIKLNAKKANEFIAANPFGVLLNSFNIKSKTQIKKLIMDLKNLFPDRKFFVAIDQEGGRVDRIKHILNQEERSLILKRAIYYGNLAKSDLKKAKKEIYQDSKNTALILKDLGFDINFAPMIDLIHQNSRKQLSWTASEDRSYGEDIQIVTQLAKEFIKGMKDAGIMVTIKHIPGIGRSYEDSHDTDAIINADLQSLKNSDFLPFKKLANLSDFAMVGHALYSDIDDKPATMSKKVMNLVRNKIGFDGFLISDALSMKALRDYSLGQRVRDSLDAGIDILIPNYLYYGDVANTIKSMRRDQIVNFNKKLRSNKNFYLND